MINSYYLFYFCAILMISSNNAKVPLKAVKLHTIHFPSETKILPDSNSDHPYHICIKKYGMTAEWHTIKKKPIPADICMQDIECEFGNKGARRTGKIVGEKPKEGTQCSLFRAEGSVKICVRGACLPFMMSTQTCVFDQILRKCNGCYRHYDLGNGTSIRLDTSLNPSICPKSYTVKFREGVGSFEDNETPK